MVWGGGHGTVASPLRTLVDNNWYVCRPGDKHYPWHKALCDSDEIHEVPLTYKEIATAEPRQLNHMRIFSDHKFQIVCDYSPPHGHVLPPELTNKIERSKM